MGVEGEKSFRLTQDARRFKNQYMVMVGGWVCATSQGRGRREAVAKLDVLNQTSYTSRAADPGRLITLPIIGSSLTETRNQSYIPSVHGHVQ